MEGPVFCVRCDPSNMQKLRMSVGMGCTVCASNRVTERGVGRLRCQAHGSFLFGSHGESKLTLTLTLTLNSVSGGLAKDFGHFTHCGAFPM